MGAESKEDGRDEDKRARTLLCGRLMPEGHFHLGPGAMARGDADMTAAFWVTLPCFRAACESDTHCAYHHAGSGKRQVQYVAARVNR